jgi:hypothetical protein
MSLKRWGIIAAVLGIALIAAAGSAVGASLNSFTAIHSPADPEEFSAEVSLGEGQEIEQVDDQHVVVFFLAGEERRPAFGFTATPAHDAIGTSVPTSLRLDEGNTLTLIVHHRAGNPAAAGSSFDYPISEGVGWEGGFQTYQVQLPPGEPRPSEPPRCVVPKLKGLSLSASRAQARAAGCRIGAVGRAGGIRTKSGHVVRQTPPAGAVLVSGTAIHLRLGR